jgi:LysR family transcriptional regulator, transcriptional activator for dmlA
MGMSPSHVSKRIAMLEQSLGVKLFVRTTRRVSITDDGEAAFLWAQKFSTTCKAWPIRSPV